MNWAKAWDNAKTDLEKQAVIEKVLIDVCGIDASVYFDILVLKARKQEGAFF